MAELPIHLFNKTVFSESSMASSLSSEAVNLNEAVSYCAQMIWSGGSSPAGNLYLAASNDGVTFTQITESLIVVSGSSGSHMVNVEKPAYAFVKVVYDRASGSGNLTALINAKRG